MIFNIYNHKITKTTQYKYVYKSKTKIINENFIVFFRNNNQNFPYFGISISGKVGNSVHRHLIKRWILEGLKITGNEFPNNYNVVFVVKNNHNLKSFKDVLDNQYSISSQIKKKI